MAQTLSGHPVAPKAPTSIAYLGLHRLQSDAKSSIILRTDRMNEKLVQKSYLQLDILAILEEPYPPPPR